jgi:hypothetical protein
MKLNETQINAIDNILEKLGVVYIDYKFEILDHIATQVEDLMAKKNLSFENSLDLILKKWEQKLKKSTNTTFGYFWEMPEILMQKAKKIYWQKMILLVIFSFILMGILLYFKDYLSKLTETILYLLAGILAIQFIGYIKIRISKHKTTFGFLYKQQFFAFLFMYFLPIHSLIVNETLLEKPVGTVFPVFFMISTLMIAPIMNLKFYNNHFEQLKRHNKLA